MATFARQTHTIMKKRLLTMISCALLAASFVQAKSLVLTLTDGTRVYYLLGGDTNPMMRLSDDGVTVNADGYTFGNLKNFYISSTDDPNGIEQQLAATKTSYHDNMLVCTAKGTDKVQVWTATGTQAKASISYESGMALVDLSHLPQGAYIVKIGQTTMKVQVK